LHHVLEEHEQRTTTTKAATTTTPTTTTTTTYVDVGAGVGLLSIGLRMLGLKVLAVDIDELTIPMLQRNAQLNSVTVESKVCDITSRDDVTALPQPCHLLCSDIIYYNGATELPGNLSHFLAGNDGNRVTIVLVDRFGGPGLTGLCGVVGIAGGGDGGGRKGGSKIARQNGGGGGDDDKAAIHDSQIAAFLAQCEDVGLIVTEVVVADSVKSKVLSDLGMGERLKWWLLNIVDDLRVYDVKRRR
jgi:hypothetical protein